MAGRAGGFEAASFNQTPQFENIGDAAGNHAELIEFHPYCHSLIQKSMCEGLRCSTFDNKSRVDRQ
jgi:hypothetical protein